MTLDEATLKRPVHGPPHHAHATKPHHDHDVAFFENDAQLADVVGGFLAEGLRAREQALVVATAAHRAAIDAHLAAAGVDVAAATADGRYAALDADDVLARLRDGAAGISADRFTAVVGAALDRFGAGRVRIYGELVDLLWRADAHADALRLESLWHEMRTRRPFALLCGYGIDAFRTDPQGQAAVDRVHAQRRPRAASPADAVATDALRACLRVTAAVADAVTDDQVYDAVVDRVAAVVGASSAALFRVVDDGARLRLVRSVGYGDVARARLADVPGDSPLPAADVVRTGRALRFDSQEALLAAYPGLAGTVTAGRAYHVACLPVVVDGRPRAALAYTFDGAPVLSDDQRDALALCARHAGHALARLRLVEDERASRLRGEILYGLARRVIEAPGVEAVFEAALDAIEPACGAKRSAILTYGADPIMRFRAWRGLSDAYRAAVDGHSPWSRDAVDPTPIHVADVDADPAWAPYLPVFRAEGVRALTFIPLCSGGRLVGKFMVYFDEPRAEDPAQAEMVRAVANHVAAGIARFAAVEELHRAVRFNEVFAGMLGHDLRNPLFAIMTGAEHLLARAEGDQVARPVSRMLSSARRMARMIEQLLDFTRLRVGTGIPIDPQTIDVGALVRDVIGEIEAAQPGRAVRLSCTGEAHGEWDGDRLAQVFSNLVANAVQHGDAAAGVDVRVDATVPDRVVVDVENTGAIADDVLPRLFEPMTGAQRRREKSQGLGLGLHITREIVKAHGGEIRVDAQGGRVRFVVALPR